MSPRLLHYSDVENAYDDPERIGRLAGRIRELDGEDVLLAGTGDNTSPGVLALVTEGEQALDFFAAVEPDVSTFGNHDFDYGPERATELVAASPQIWVTANVRWNGERFGATAGTEPWTTLAVDGATVGVTGVTTDRTASINPMAGDLTFTDPVEAASEAVAELRDQGVDYVVVLSHLGTGDEELARAVDADVVLGGHVPTALIETVDGTLLTRPGDGGRGVIEVDPGAGSATRHPVADAPSDASVGRALRERAAEAGLDETVATVDEPIARDESALFEGESRVGNLVADAYRWATGADVALQNSGGIRSGDPLVGEVTVADLLSLVPFEEPVSVAELTGAELRTVLAEGANGALGFAEPDWWHAHVGGVEFVYDRGAGEVRDLRVGGEPVDPDATYTLATSDYLFYTDDEFPTLDEHHRERRHGVQYDVLVEYARETGLATSLEGRVELRGDP
ncbi:bifunctional metallophosphatase/5'-nucleotidase [Halobacteriales archaeon QS_1_68_20]|nr:MAG: bifunctional metallophosphatase/5'-nucleotidase [Halobacteriales archaeon QS_1_68_20]